MDDFLLCTRFSMPQRDIVVGGCASEPDISNFVSEVVVTAEEESPGY
jgi:hypothetical protein